MTIAPVLLYSLLTAADCGSTAVALSRPGVRETNPLFSSAGGCAAAHVALVTAPLTVIDAQMHGHQRRVFRVAAFAVQAVAGAWIAQHNLSVRRKP